MICIKVGQLQAQADWQLRRRNLKKDPKRNPGARTKKKITYPERRTHWSLGLTRIQRAIWTEEITLNTDKLQTKSFINHLSSYTTYEASTIFG